MEKGFVRVYDWGRTIDVYSGDYSQKIEIVGNGAPDFMWKFPIPELFSWDNSGCVEEESMITVETVRGSRKHFVEIHQWARRGRVWREIKIDGEKHTEEIRYSYHWDHGELRKEIEIIWDEAVRENISASEMDGLGARYLFREVKRRFGPPGFFWYRRVDSNLSEYDPAVRFRHILNPDVSPSRLYVCQDFGYTKWPPDFWVKVWDCGRVFMITEKAQHVNGGVVLEWERIL